MDFKIFTGPPPATCEDQDSGTVLLSLAEGMMSHLTSRDTWDKASRHGAPGHFRVYDFEGKCAAQGTVSESSDGGEMRIDGLLMVPGARIDGFTGDMDAPQIKSSGA